MKPTDSILSTDVGSSTGAASLNKFVLKCREKTVNEEMNSWTEF